MTRGEYDRLFAYLRDYREAFFRYDLGKMLGIMLKVNESERRVLMEYRRDLVTLKVN